MQGNTYFSRRNAKSVRANRWLLFIITGLIFLDFNGASLLAKGRHHKKKGRSHKPEIHNSFSARPLPARPDDSDDKEIFLESGLASCYGKNFHNSKTSSGEAYKSGGYSAAHRTAPFGTILRVTNTKNGKSALVRVNDRGPFVRHRVIDISYNAARDIDDIGTPDVRVEGFRNVKDLGNSDSLLCFSFYYPLARLNPNSLFIADSTHDFNEAIDKYRKLSDSGLGSCSFIAVPASLYHSKNAIFYLAFLNPAKEILLDDEVAKDLINNPGKR